MIVSYPRGVLGLLIQLHEAVGVYVYDISTILWPYCVRNVDNLCHGLNRSIFFGGRALKAFSPLRRVEDRRWGLQIVIVVEFSHLPLCPRQQTFDF
jgi:hypothetical protein